MHLCGAGRPKALLTCIRQDIRPVLAPRFPQQDKSATGRQSLVETERWFGMAPRTALLTCINS
jgi:hypothetical protein